MAVDDDASFLSAQLGYSRHSTPDSRLGSQFVSKGLPGSASARRIGMVSPYAPTTCGPANFTGSLRTALRRDRSDVQVAVVRVDANDNGGDAAEIVYQLSSSDGEFWCRSAAAQLNKTDVVVFQFDPTSFGGSCGEQALLILNWIRVPTVVVFHDVPASLSPTAQAVLRALAESADAVVTLSETARQRLIRNLHVPPRKTLVILHGADTQVAQGPRRSATPQAPTILTWGFLAPGAGIEWAVEAMEKLRHLEPLPRYLVAGPTHPRELAMDGDRYRNMLAAKVSGLGLSHMVKFAGDHVSRGQLRRLTREADVLLICDDSPDVASSAVLVEAIAARRPVVATRFAHARELLEGMHGGLLVAHKDPEAIAAALTRILTNPDLGERLVGKASGLADALSWAVVAAQYRLLFDVLLRQKT